MLKGLIALLALIASAQVQTKAQRTKLQVALTFDDLPSTGAAPPDVTRAQIMDSILAP